MLKNRAPGRYTATRLRQRDVTGPLSEVKISLSEAGL
jgi:hypothetical protein